MDKDIAIIGMACRFPGAQNYEEFWDNLKEGRSSIGEIPKERWDWKAYWGDPQSGKNKSNSKWGGFIQDADAFDPGFFGLSAREVEATDPQQRIMLELSWACLEDAGVLPSHISGEKIGVYMGVFNFDYKGLQERTDQTIETYHSIGTASAVIANRISHYFNLKGPSFPIDTACSSSFNAIHAAAQSLQLGECRMALAGGVSLILTPSRHISFSKAGMLSPTGSCKTFDDSADGYVRSEGAGVILLKPLKQALEDRDPIYGVLKGSAVNHSGRTHTLTYPNPDAQAEAIVEAHQKASVPVDSIGYIEAHGTGTPKGDPMEFRGLVQAFDKLRLGQDSEQPLPNNYCGLGSVKTNIGHLESAAGIAGVIKVLMSMKHKQLPGLQNFRKLNHRISLESTPFYIVDQLRPWEPLKSADGQPLPRRAGISSFGFGGTNAHVVLEEAPPRKKAVSRRLPYSMICISGKTEEALQQRLRDLRQWLEREEGGYTLTDISATLLLRREHFGIRGAFVVKDIHDLRDKLNRVLAGEAAEGWLTGKIPVNGVQDPSLHKPLAEALIEEIRSLKKNDAEEYESKLKALADVYVQGYETDWRVLYPASGWKHVHLPTYPFARERYWIPEEEPGTKLQEEQVLAVQAIHPLLHQNTSDLLEQRFSSAFTGKEFFLEDHRVNGERVLPGVVYLEMARAAVEQAAGYGRHPDAAVIFRNVVWSVPVKAGTEPVQIHVGLYPEEGQVAFEIYSGRSGMGTDEVTVHSQGSSFFATPEPMETIPVQKRLEALTRSADPMERCYAFLGAMGFDYGPAHRGITAVYEGNEQLMVKLSLPEPMRRLQEQLVLHPTLMDSALQAAILLVSGPVPLEKDSSPGILMLPFALDELLILAPCTAEMWAQVHYSNDHRSDQRTHKVDIDLTDAEGSICVRMKGLSLREATRSQNDAGNRIAGKFPDAGVTLMEPQWTEQISESRATTVPYREHLIIFCECPEPVISHTSNVMRQARVLSWQDDSRRIDERYEQYAVRLLKELQACIEDRTPGNVMIQLITSSSGEASLITGLGGMLQTAALEHPKLKGQILEIHPEMVPEAVVDDIRESMLHPSGFHVRCEPRIHKVMDWKPVEGNPGPNSHEIPWKDKGIYLITGGLGGLGIIFAREISTRVKDAVIILTGRSLGNEEKSLALEALRSQGARVEYIQTDVSVPDEANKLIQHVVQAHGTINGIIHSAGVIRDSFLIHKTIEELHDVLSPKVAGLVNLDESSRSIALDFFVVFSSVFGAAGNPGQADYCSANAFMDAYAEYRNVLVSTGERSGRTLAVNWPLWQGGGMHVEESIEKSMLLDLGMVPIANETGIKAFYRAFATEANQVLVMEGDPNRFYAKLLNLHLSKKERTPNQIQAEMLRQADSSLPEDALLEKSENYLKQLISKVLKLPASRIDAEAPMEQYGIDSIMTTQLTRELEQTFGSLSKTLFFEYQNIRELTGYFLQEHRETLLKALGPAAPLTETDSVSYSASMDDIREVPLPASHRRPRFVTSQVAGQKPPSSGPFEVAVIGVAGRYPGAGNVNEFWEVLKNGMDCITEIPEERWDYRLYYDEDRARSGKAYSKWGGFIEGVDRFDPLFFNISPREAQLLDPQERLFLQCVYETMEDAGYTRETLAHSGNVGVYVGSMYQEYQLYGAQEQARGNPLALPGLPASIANRVSYFCNFHGPSLTVDTMCSSSLTAIHLACQSLQSGECEVSFAGGVNVSVHPNKYLYLSQGQFISGRGRCESFGQGGEGYVPGEGVGAVLLKPLSQAVKDGDQIYGVIKATSINHGGKTNGYTVPNPNAQANVIGSALRKAGVHPRTISYVEAHGTGTVLGDPIEIAGLQQVFRQVTEDKQFCAIGSAKSNIGHCESAAGIAGLTKVLLQLKHKQLVPSLHSAVLNPHIDFENSAFAVQQELTDWSRPVLNLDGRLTEYPRIAGISSFGAGGSNAHLVIEEYIPLSGESAHQRPDPTAPYMIVLSAKTEGQLKEQAKRLLDDVEKQQYPDSRLGDMAYTLQTGREAMEERLALIVLSIGDLKQKLRVFIDGSDEPEGIYYGQVKRNKDTMQIFTRDEELQEAIWKWMERKKYDKLMNLWVKGLQVDWSKLYGETHPRRMSLPTYPFSQDRYWVPGLDIQRKVSSNAGGSVWNDTQEAGPSRDYCFVNKQWEPSPADRIGFAGSGSEVAVIATSETMTLAQYVSARLGGAVLLNVDAGDFVPLVSRTDAFKGIIDLVGCGSSVAGPNEWIPWLQKQIEFRRQEGLRLLCVTRGLESFHNKAIHLTGADRAALYRMLQNEYNRLVSRHMDADFSTSDGELAEQIAAEFAADSKDAEVCYREGIRYRAYLGEILNANKAASPSMQSDSFAFPKDHVLWITGGTRGLGYACAHHFIQKYGVTKLVLTGREELPPRDQWREYSGLQTSMGQKIRGILSLESLGAEVHVRTVSLTDETALSQAVDEIKHRLGPIGGVVHCAGVVDAHNPAFIRKTEQEIERVLSPKISGLDALFSVMKREPLQFFILYSSVSAAIPSLAAGQSDYSMANAYMDYFAGAMHKECPVVSIQWPSWKETGMGEVRNRAYEETGLLSLSNDEGLQLLDTILAEGIGPVVLPAAVNSAKWNPAKLLQFSAGEEGLSDRRNKQVLNQDAVIKPETAIHPENPQQLVAALLTELLAEELRIDSSKLDPDTSFQDYGVDSIMLAQLLRRMNDLMNTDLEPTLLFEYSTIETLASWLVKYHASEAIMAARSTVITAASGTASSQGDGSAAVANADREPLGGAFQRDARIHTQSLHPSLERPASLDIAVVGMSCRFPGAESLEEYWTLLTEGTSAIREVPPERWGYSSGYHAGWIDDITSFDASYFLISEADARAMDPQALMLLEESVNVICHAGYTLQEIKGKPFGVYLGARSQHHPGDDALLAARNPIVAVGQNYLAANISQFLDLRGPSLVVDTACSSALVGLNMAVQALRNGDIQGAMVGGIHLLTTDQAHKIFEQRGILNPSPHFHVFDGRSGGIVPGEGAGMVLLKTVEQAIQDGDRIYAVIQGMAVNNDGRTAGPAAPNLEAQRGVLRAALANSGKKPEEITYIETNGSGTEVTDLLELKTIQSVYRGESWGPLGLGSIKPNIGHPLCAEGIAGLIKVVLMLHHGQLVPFLSGQEPMAHYDIKASPFYFVREATEWNASFRAAALNCFADGGTNVHVILEEAGTFRSYSDVRSPLPNPVWKKRPMKPEVSSQLQHSGRLQTAETPQLIFWERFD
jgi:acyl transferase domain-containing protein/acyl carrier protein